MHIHSCNRRGLAVCLTVGALLSLHVCSSFADKVVLTIRAGNPAPEARKVQIKANLPDRVGTNDIINLSGLELGYDVKNNTYYVHKEIELDSKAYAVFDVEMRDIWVVAEEELSALTRRTGDLVKMLDGVEEYSEPATALQSDISKSIEAIRVHQEENSIQPGVSPVRHIRAYETNLKVLTRVKKDVGRIENLVLASGQDPGTLVGSSLDTPRRRAPRIADEEYKTAVYRISLRNTSPTEARRININRELPEEVTAADVIDAGELEVRTDSKRGVTYVFKKDVQIGPNETLVYKIKIRDKWDINVPRIDDMRERINDMIGQIGEKDQYASVDEKLNGLLGELGRVRGEERPTELNAAYVAFYREQARRLDGIEQSIHRIEAALRPIQKQVKRGFRIQPPSLKTTWLIIYVILGFLALVSLLFLLRWMGKSKADKM